MAARNLANLAEENQTDALSKIRDAADGPGKTPYLDGRELATYMSGHLQHFKTTVELGGTEDDAGNLITNADDLTITLPFVAQLCFVQTSAGRGMFASRGLAAGQALSIIGTPAADGDFTFGTGDDDHKITLGNGLDVMNATDTLVIHAFGPAV